MAFEGRSSGRSSGRSRSEYGSSSRSSERSSGRGRPSSGGRGSFEKHIATCDKCGSRCELPFKPTGEKPVLCSDCFRKEGPSRPSRNDSNDDLKEINRKLDKILDLLTE
ncbi:MAG: hypothetical protein PHU51_00555 [Candidatus Nanoarchaeia archaeon]|jgi:CxxC-x17-CxxC domain-containing protein|nr:hypothetical protein [Candidatus Nanoarchaeia archaeon]